jgi:hypothetical protein
MGFLDFFKKRNEMLPVISDNKPSISHNIPEPTKSLLYVTNEDLSKISSPFQIKLTVSVTNQGTQSDTDDGHNFYGEPSLIWTRLPVRANNRLEQKPIYFPSYSNLSPELRYQYLNWLGDITEPTNLSYVFLYYYGLERQLLTGNFDLAFNEISKLLRHHDKGTFRSYAETALIVSALYRQRFELIKKNEFLYNGVSNEELILKKFMGINLTTKDLLALAYPLKLKNKRYLKLYLNDFEIELDKLLTKYERENGPIIDSVAMEELEKEPTSAFANYSLKDKMRSVNIPNILNNEKFKDICLNLLETAHKNLKDRKFNRS